MKCVHSGNFVTMVKIRSRLQLLSNIAFSTVEHFYYPMFVLLLYFVNSLSLDLNSLLKMVCLSVLTNADVLLVELKIVTW